MYTLLFDIGGTDIKYGIINQQHRFIMKDKMTTDIRFGGLSIIEQVIDKAQALKSSHDVTGIAVSSAGVIDPTTGIVLSATDTIKNFKGLAIKEMLETKTNLFTTVINDVNAMALCEAYFGDHHSNHFIALTIGTGIGGAIVVDNQIYHGHAMSAGEFGRMFIDGQTFESLASMSSIIKAAQKANLNVSDGYDLFQRYDQKDPIAFQIITDFYAHLAKGLANLIYAFNPPLIIIGGGISNRGEQLIKDIKAALKKILDPYFYDHCEIALASHLNDAGMLGAWIHYNQMKALKKPSSQPLG